DLVRIVYTCTGCGTCEEVCKPIPTSDIVAGLRYEIFKEGKQPEGTKKIDEKLSNSFNRFGLDNSQRAKWAEDLGIPNKGDDMYFVGCGTSLSPQLTKIAVATAGILKHVGMDIAYLGETERCCGMPAGSDGNTDLHTELAKSNINAMRSAGAKRIIFNCPECYMTWSKTYPELVGELPFETIHISELLAELIDEGKLKFNEKIEKTVTFHDPCHLGRIMRIFDEPRKVLESIPGITLKEMERNKRWAYCCGYGSMAVFHAFHDYATKISDERMAEAKAAANTVVTSCPQCALILSSATKRASFDCAVEDLSTLVAKSLGI
ncbi:MAG: (Fe-S)-binding protein, partial [Candidatus Thorarchaeota archaeon]